MSSAKLFRFIVALLLTLFVRSCNSAYVLSDLDIGINVTTVLAHKSGGGRLKALDVSSQPVG